MNAESKRNRTVPLAWMQPAVVAGCFVPLAWLIVLAGRHGLGANPVAEVLNQFGYVALVLLIASLSCTPLRIVSGWNWPFKLRKTLGLLAFTYACLHVLTYTGLDQLGNIRAIWKDVTERKFIFVGMAAFVSLVPLALTSTAGSIRRMGSKKWKRLHRMAYVAGALAVVHFIFRVKADLREPLIYGAVLSTMLLARVVKRQRDRLRTGKSSVR